LDREGDSDGFGQRAELGRKGGGGVREKAAGMGRLRIWVGQGAVAVAESGK